jgi:SAM-dependent methyltransferase
VASIKLAERQMKAGGEPSAGRTAEASRPAWLAAKLACPNCRAAVVGEDEALRCVGCGAAFADGDMLDEQALADPEGWRARLDECDAWYADLRQSAEAAADLYEQDYAPFRGFLQGLAGDVLDVGGGVGVPRAWLPEGVNYVSLEPSLEWTAPQWGELARRWPRLATPPERVRGVGERLPFQDRAFDAVLLMWSLNHVEDPQRVMAEVGRVLRPGGEVLLVLEDMRPRWGDPLAPGFWRSGRRKAAAMLREMVRTQLTGAPWPLQPDHVRIEEPALATWLAPSLRLCSREWLGGYLTYRLTSAESAPS